MSADPFAGWQTVPRSGMFAQPPAAVVLDDTTVHLFAVGADTVVYHNWAGINAAQLTWVGWEPVAPGAVGVPAVVNAEAGALDVFFVGTDSALRHVSRAGATWSAPDSFGEALRPGVTAVVAAAGEIDIVGCGLDGRLRYLHRGRLGFGSWQQRDGALASVPSAVAWTRDLLQVVALGPGSDLLHQSYDRSVNAWSGWETLGGQLSTAPTLVAPSQQRLDVFARGTDLSLQHRFWDGHSWGGRFGSLGGSLSGPPAAVADPKTGRIEVLAAQLDHSAGRVFWDGGWGSFTSQGGRCAAPPVPLILFELHQLFEAALGTDGNIHVRRIPL